MSIVEIAEANVGSGINLIANGVNHDAVGQNEGLGAMLGMIITCIGLGINTKPKLVKEMRFAVPGISKKFWKQLLDLLTGSDPQKQLLKKHPNGTYSIINAEPRGDQSSPAGVQ